MTEITECTVCDFKNAKRISRATWVCPKCGRDFSLEYLFWYEAAHPETDSEADKNIAQAKIELK